MISANSRVDFPAGKIYSYNQNKPQKQANTELEKETAQKTDYTDAVALSSATSNEGKTVNMSEKAQNYLSDLKEKYKDYDFVVADFDSDEEAKELLNSADGKINVLITPDTLEKMANDSETAAYYESIISEADSELSSIKEKLGENADMVEKYGFSVDADGKVNYYALMKESFKTVDENGEETDEVSANFLDEMLAKIDEIAKKHDAAVKEQEELENRPSTLPPKSFEKYLKKEEDTTYPIEEDYGNLPPESFKKYQKKPDIYSTEEDYGNLPPESFKKYLKDSELDIKA